MNKKVVLIFVIFICGMFLVAPVSAGKWIDSKKVHGGLYTSLYKTYKFNNNNVAVYHYKYGHQYDYKYTIKKSGKYVTVKKIYKSGGHVNIDKRKTNLNAVQYYKRTFFRR